MLMCFRNAIREFEMCMIESVRIRKLLKILIGKYFFYLAAHRLIESVIIIDIKKSSGFEIGAQALGFSFGEIHIAVPRHKEKRIIKNIVTCNIDPAIFRDNFDIRMLLDKS